jgi:hypothetical protein
MSEETPERRTLKMMLARPELVDHLACNVWRHETGESSHEVWAAMPEEERQRWIALMWKQHREYNDATPEEQGAINAASWKRTLENNDRAYADE